MYKYLLFVLICFAQITCGVAQSPTNQLVETFEDKAMKSKYEAAELAFNTGSWWLENALVGMQEGDAHNGYRSLRIKQGGIARPLFAVNGYIKEVSLQAATYGTKDANGLLQLWCSKDNGATWQQVGETQKCNENTLQTFTFPMKASGVTCFEVRNTSSKGDRINVDDFTIIGKAMRTTAIPSPQTAKNSNDTETNTETKDENKPHKPKDKNQSTTDNSGLKEHLLFGNPSKATANESDYDNFLMAKREFVVSYNRSRGTPNWVAWRLSQSWNGTAERSNDFRPDNSLPESWFHAKHSDYTGSGFDRGHLCSSGDRDIDQESNSITFLMTNIIPQSSANNQGAWNALELYCRGLVDKGDELYIYAGVDGVGGEGKNGKVTKLADGKITVPANTWKIVVVMPKGVTSPKKITANTRVIAIRMPNNMGVPKEDWGKYRVSIDKIEQVTGYDFLSEIPKSIQDILETKVDNGPVY